MYAMTSVGSTLNFVIHHGRGNSPIRQYTIRLMCTLLWRTHVHIIQAYYTSLLIITLTCYGLTCYLLCSGVDPRELADRSWNQALESGAGINWMSALVSRQQSVGRIGLTGCYSRKSESECGKKPRGTFEGTSGGGVAAPT